MENSTTVNRVQQPAAYGRQQGLNFLPVYDNFFSYMKKIVAVLLLPVLLLAAQALFPEMKKKTDSTHAPTANNPQNKTLTRLLNNVQGVGNDKMKQGIALYELGLFYYNTKEFSKALDKLLEAAALLHEIGDKKYLCASYSLIGGSYYGKEKYAEALEFHSKSLAIREKLRDALGISMSYYLIAQCCFHLKEYTHALEFFEKARQLFVKLKNKSSMTEALIGIGKTYARMKNNTRALHYLGTAGRTAREIKRFPQEREAAREIVEIYKSTGDYKNALFYHKIFHQADLQVIYQSSEQEIQRLNQLYDTEYKQELAEILKKDKQLGELRLNKTQITRNGFIIGFFLVSIILGLLFKKYLYLFASWKKQKYIGRYKLTEKIGSGAMGTVYKARSLVEKSQTAAVKILKEELFSNENSKKRFKQEAVIIDKLEHPHIVRIFERGEHKNRLFTAMELLTGQDLETLLNQRQLSLAQCLPIMLQVAETLVFIHGKNIIHRDIKPANIMLIQNKGNPYFVKLLDFGLAKMETQTRLTQSGNFIGTVEYIAPEQILNADTSAANDIFSLGVIFYRLVTGQKAFPGETVIEVMRGIVGISPVEPSKTWPGIPPLLNLLVMKMIAKDPAQRPSAQVVRNTLVKLTEQMKA